MDTTTGLAASCPPHYWQVAEERRIQHWTCYRCGAAQERPRGSWNSNRLVRSHDRALAARSTEAPPAAADQGAVPC
jgi:hypothetical protein